MKRLAPAIALIGFTLFFPHASSAVKVADITRISGQRTNTLEGTGLVVGLKGTGDGGDYAPAMKELAAMLGRFANPTQIAELSKAANVAIVVVTVTVPATGVRNGDHADASVQSIGAASSLRGGRLFICPMLGPVPKNDKGSGIFATTEGMVDVQDITAPNVGTVHGGCTFEFDLKTEVVQNGQFILVLSDPSANWTTANTIATVINDLSDSTEGILAAAVDAKTINVAIPRSERAHPDAFISRVLQLPVLLLPTEARVNINDKTGTMIVTGDVEISPVVICHKGLTISTVNPPPVPRPAAPITTTHEAIPVATNQENGGKLQDLANAFDQLRVPAEDRIEIVKLLYKSGKLHAKLIINGTEM